MYLRNRRRSVTVIPTNSLSSSSSCPDFEEKIKNSLARKRSDPVTPDVDTLSMLSFASNSSVTSCPESSLCQGRVNPNFKKRSTKKAFRYILPDKLRFKKKEKYPMSPIDSDINYTQPPLFDSKQRRPSELNLSPVVPKTSKLKSRKKSLPSLDLNIRPFHARKSTLGVNDSVGPFPVRIVVSCTGEELTKRQVAVDLEGVDSPAGKRKLSPYSKLLGKSMELVSGLHVLSVLYSLLIKHPSIY